MISNPKVQAAITLKSLTELADADTFKDMQLEIGYVGYRVINKTTGHWHNTVGTIDGETTIKVVNFAADDLDKALALAEEFHAIPTSVKASVL